MAEAQNSNVLNMQLLMGENPPAALLADDAGGVVLKLLPKNPHRELNLRHIENEEIKAKLMANCMDYDFVSAFRMLSGEKTLQVFLALSKERSDFRFSQRSIEGQGKGGGRGRDRGFGRGRSSANGGAYSLDQYHRSNTKGKGKGKGFGRGTSQGGRGRSRGICYNVRDWGKCDRPHCKFPPCCDKEPNVEATVAAGMTDAQKARMLAALSPPATAEPAAKRGKTSLFENAEIYVIEDGLNLIAELKADKNLVAALGDIHDMSRAIWDKNKGKFYEVSVPREGSDIKAMIEVSFVCDGKYVVCRALADTGSTVTIMRASYWEKFLKDTEATVKVYKFKHKKNFSAANNGQVMCDSL